MLFTNCQFAEGIDISDVIPYMDIDLEEALLSGIVPQNGIIPEYNGIEETDQIVGRVYDVFDAIEHQRSLNNAMNNYRASLSNKASETIATSTSTEAE